MIPSRSSAVGPPDASGIAHRCSCLITNVDRTPRTSTSGVAPALGSSITRAFYMPMTGTTALARSRDPSPIRDQVFCLWPATSQRSTMKCRHAHPAFLAGSGSRRADEWLDERRRLARRPITSLLYQRLQAHARLPWRHTVPTQHAYDLRDPRGAARGSREFLNVGVILSCAARDFLDAHLHLTAAAAAFDPHWTRQCWSTSRVIPLCVLGERAAGPIGAMSTRRASTAGGAAQHHHPMSGCIAGCAMIPRPRGAPDAAHGAVSPP